MIFPGDLISVIGSRWLRVKSLTHLHSWLRRFDKDDILFCLSISKIDTLDQYDFINVMFVSLSRDKTNHGPGIMTLTYRCDDIFHKI